MHFQRIFLPRQVADRLAAELRNGAWPNHLPGERKLQVFFGVSRRTIRAALTILMREKMVRFIDGHRTFVAFSKSPPVGQVDKVVVLLVDITRRDLLVFSHWMADLRHYAAVSGYTLHIEIMPVKVNVHRWLETINKDYRAAVWLLVSLGKDVQRWFEQRRLPSLIVGSRYDGIQLPEIDFDYQAVCRHAAHTLLRLGHRRIVFLNIDSGCAGDLASERGFLEAFSAYAPGTVRAPIVRHTGNADKLGRLLARLFNVAEPPSAIVVSIAYYAVTVMGYLSRMGKRVPEDVSVICRDDDPLFEFVVPSPAHYRVDMNLYSRRAMKMAVRIDQGGSISSSLSSRIMPRFVPGKSVAAARV